MRKLILLVLIVLPFAILILTSCTYKGVSKPDEEASKYTNLVNEYCSKNNLKVDSYLGKTILRGKDFKSSDLGKEPVVYEWQVVNKASNKKFVLWVGPIMQGLQGFKPMVTIAKERYTLQGQKVEEVK